MPICTQRLPMFLGKLCAHAGFSPACTHTSTQYIMRFCVQMCLLPVLLLLAYSISPYAPVLYMYRQWLMMMSCRHYLACSTALQQGCHWTQPVQQLPTVSALPAKRHVAGAESASCIKQISVSLHSILVHQGLLH